MAEIDVEAHDDITILGNVTALGGAHGGGTGNTGEAIINIHAGLGGSGDLAIIGNVTALAVADPVNDHALASITLAGNHILLVGADPVAKAVAGGLSAFRQSHFTTHDSLTGAGGTSATARITITADPGGVIAIDPAAGEPNIDALIALPIYDQPFPSNALSVIPLALDAQPCGVLGEAGAPAATTTAKACTKPPINVSESDMLP